MPTPVVPRSELQRTLDAYIRADGSQRIAADVLGVSEPTVYRRLQMAKAMGLQPTVVSSSYRPVSLDNIAPFVGARYSGSPPRPSPPILGEDQTTKPRVRVVAGSSVGGTATRVLVLGDAHDDPRIPKDRFRWIGKHAAVLGVHWVVSIGDFTSLDSLNSHVGNDTITGKSKSPFKTDMASLAEALGELDAGLGEHKPRKHITFGNHERRAWYFEEQRPEIMGILTGDLLTTFEGAGWTHSDYGEWWFLGGVGFIHVPLNKLSKTFGGEIHSNILNKMVFDIVRGHDHNQYVKTSSKFGPAGQVTLVGTGCSLPHGHVEDYAKHALNGWAWGVTELTIRGGQIEAARWTSMLELEQRYGN